MKKKPIRLTESALNRIVRESVKKVLKENKLYGMTRLTGVELYDRIDEILINNNLNAKVSRFYSDENQITIAVEGNTPSKAVKEIMANLGYNYYTSGGNGNYLMMTFEQM